MTNRIEANLIRAGKRVARLQRKGYLATEEEIERESREKRFGKGKYGYICMTCGKTQAGGVNKDGECKKCVRRNLNNSLI